MAAAFQHLAIQLWSSTISNDECESNFCIGMFLVQEINVTFSFVVATLKTFHGCKHTLRFHFQYSALSEVSATMGHGDSSRFYFGIQI